MYCPKPGRKPKPKPMPPGFFSIYSWIILKHYSLITTPPPQPHNSWIALFLWSFEVTQKRGFAPPMPGPLKHIHIVNLSHDRIILHGRATQQSLAPCRNPGWCLNLAEQLLWTTCYGYLALAWSSPPHSARPPYRACTPIPTPYSEALWLLGLGTLVLMPIFAGNLPHFFVLTLF